MINANTSDVNWISKAYSDQMGLGIYDLWWKHLQEITEKAGRCLDPAVMFYQLLLTQNVLMSKDFFSHLIVYLLPRHGWFSYLTETFMRSQYHILQGPSKSEVKLKDISNICSKSRGNWIFWVKSLDNFGEKWCLINFLVSEVFKTVIDQVPNSSGRQAIWI